jgi:hypothetical protein
MTPFHTVVRNYDIIPPHAYIAFNLPTTLTAADVGKAVALDSAAANKVKLAGEDDIIIGRLETVEVRSASQVVGTVAISGIMKLPIDTGETINVGDTVVGNGSATGACKAKGSADLTDNYVVEVIGTTHVVVVKK